ncbi:MAG: hypothetical protein ACE5R6_05030 [Candidatus Heimdallarchaeota archaeon]
MRPLLRTGYGVLLTSVPMGVLMGYSVARAYVPVTGMALAGGILAIGILTFYSAFSTFKWLSQQTT